MTMYTSRIDGKLLSTRDDFRGYYLDDFDHLLLQQDDGQLIDIILRFQEFTQSANLITRTSDESYDRSKRAVIGVRYYTSNNKKSWEEVEEGFLRTVMGVSEVGYDANHYEYSEYTSGTDYDSNLKIGEHNLFNNLLAVRGKYVYLEMYTGQYDK